jgi:hypothetical protein
MAYEVLFVEVGHRVLLHVDATNRAPVSFPDGVNVKPLASLLRPEIAADLQ